MIIEHITLRPNAESRAALEAAVAEAVPIFKAAKGCLGIEMARGVEDPEAYIILIRWATLEDHTEGFRGSELFTQWRALAGPHFGAPPVVVHFDVTLPATVF